MRTGVLGYRVSITSTWSCHCDGDFNACNIEGMNAQGHLLHGVLERYGLNAVSLGSVVSGPGYTYCSGSTCQQLIIF